MQSFSSKPTCSCAGDVRIKPLQYVANTRQRTRDIRSTASRQFNNTSILRVNTPVYVTVRVCEFCTRTVFCYLSAEAATASVAITKTTKPRYRLIFLKVVKLHPNSNLDWNKLQPSFSTLRLCTTKFVYYTARLYCSLLTDETKEDVHTTAQTHPQQKQFQSPKY